MKTTIDIPEKELKELLKHTKARTKREAVVRAVEDFNRRMRLQRLAGILGTLEDFMDQADLQKMRKDRTWKAER